MANYDGSIIAVGDFLVYMKIPLLLLWLKVFLFLPGWSQIGHSQRHGPQEVVIPLKVTNTGRDVKSHGWLSYRLYFGGKIYVIHIKVKKHFLSKNLPVFTYTDQGALLEDHPFIQNDCYYHGYVEGDPESLVSLNTCLGGFQGMLQTNDIVYKVEPKRLSTTFEHLVYKMDNEETEFPPMSCGLTDEEIEQQVTFQESVNSTLMQSGYEGWWTHRRFLEVAVVVDHTRYLHHQRNTSLVQNEVCFIFHGISDLLKSLDIDVFLMGIEVWTEESYVSLHSIGDGLNGFCKWKRRGFNTRLPHDVAHIFVKKDFGTNVGLAFVGTVCKTHTNCGIDSFLNGDITDSAYIVSHEIGHNLGMGHDDTKTCGCGRSKCIMFPYKATTTKFSNCSYMNYWNRIAQKPCVYTSPDPQKVFMIKGCGNRVVDEGEQCDCGSRYMCEKDPCCQSDCTLTAGADCAFGLCCEECSFMPAGSMCRKEENECDLPEWCNGTSHQCPEDVYMQDGTSCTGGGYCYEKRCNNHNEQCRKIFGKQARSADQSCYREMNTRGDRFGNCGLKATKYIRCNISDILCGRLQCENVTEIPLLRDHSTVHWTHFNGVTCWGTDHHLGMTLPDVGEVKDGTECGAGHVCIQRKCVHMSLWESACSPETCNMSGVCNNRHHCHCNSGWAPPKCLLKGSGGSVDSGPPPGKNEKVERKSNLLPLWLILLFVLLVSLLLLIFMRRT
uniref:Disintegrin and metalloproteinase domain-containing protein 25-like n=1 Tax=Sus scrofa TaxID=9823 RepID=A0A8D0MGM2_PIG